MMSGFDECLKRMEEKDCGETYGEKTKSSPRQSAIAVLEKAFSPEESSRKSPVKGLKSVADESCALKREGA